MARIFEYCRAHPRGRASLSRRTEPRRRQVSGRHQILVIHAPNWRSTRRRTAPPSTCILNKLYDVGLPLVVVADPDQAIYGFRGAATHALTSLAGRLGRHDLTHNWRSTTVICKVAATLRSDPARRAADIAVACHHDAPHPVIVYAGGDRDVNTADFIGYATKLDISPGDCLVLAHAQTTLPKTYAGAATPPSSKAAYGRQLTVRSARAAGASWDTNRCCSGHHQRNPRGRPTAGGSTGRQAAAVHTATRAWTASRPQPPAH
jgi:UvrD/REP helicase N-terminal domain